MSSAIRSSRKRVEAFIRKISTESEADASTVQQNALRAHSMAVAADSRVLEAEALLQLGRSYSPALEPRSMLMSLQLAEKIFRVNGLHVQAVSCRVASARALHDLGQERDAIAMADNALVEVSLPTAQRVGVYLVKALSHGQLGELDEAVKLLKHFALPIAEQGGGEALLPHVKRGLAITYVRAFVIKRHPRLWQILPEQPTLDIEVPSPHYVLSLLDDATAAFPSALGPNYVDITRQFLLGLFGSSQSTMDKLREIATDSIQRDPPMACWALNCKGLVQRHVGQLLPALDSFAEAKSLAQQWGLKQMLREVTLQLALVKEELGDFSGSLFAYKAFSEMLLRSVTYSLGSTPETTVPQESEDTGPTGYGDGTHRLRNLEPRHVKKALRFIEENLREPISVDDVVSQAGVGRRTLEIAFKESKTCTVAQFIKRRKLELAAIALRSTDQSVQEVARSVGYRWPAAFSRDFVAQFGAKPSAWRQVDSRQQTTKTLNPSDGRFCPVTS